MQKATVAVKATKVNKGMVSAGKGKKATVVTLVAPASVMGTMAAALAVHVAAQAAPVAPVAKGTPTAAAIAAVQAAQIAPVAAMQSQTPATVAQASALVAHKASKPLAGNLGGTYTPGTVGAQIAAACNALVALNGTGYTPTAAAVLAHMPTVWVKGVVVALNAQSASCGVSHWRKGHGALRVKGQPTRAPVAPVVALVAPVAHSAIVVCGNYAQALRMAA
jgi:hypothetical protein